MMGLRNQGEGDVSHVQIGSSGASAVNDIIRSLLSHLQGKCPVGGFG